MQDVWLMIKIESITALLNVYIEFYTRHSGILKNSEKTNIMNLIKEQIKELIKLEISL